MSSSRFTLLSACLVLVAIALAAAPARAQTDRRSVTMVVGEQTTISAEGVRSYSEGAPNVVDVRVTKDGGQFVVVALRPGSTSLLLIFEDGQKVQYAIRVLSSRDDEGAIGDKENVRLDFYFVELSENYSHQIGVGWPANFGGAGAFRLNAAYDLVDDNLAATAVVANQPLPRLDILQSGGWVRISRHAVLVTANGNEATYSSGGEVNLAIQGALTAEIRRIEFGSLIRVLPRYDANSGRVELLIAADVSDLTDDRGSGIPGRTVSRLETLVNLEMGQGVMLAGLNAHTDAATKTGLPLLSQIPVLGWLFGSHGNREEETKNVLFIVPTVVDVVRPSARRQIDEALELFEQYDGDLDGVDFIGTPAPEAERRSSDRDSRRNRRRGDRDDS